MAQTEAQRQLIAQIQAGQPSPAQSQSPEVDSQRLRMMGQGLTLGFADEIEAAVRAAMNGELSYEQALGDIRGKIDAYKKENPMTALGYEALGAMPTALIGGAPATFGRMALRAGAEGAIAGAGQAEGGVGERIAAMPAGAAFGAAGGAVLGGAGSALGAGAAGIVDFARSKLGDKGASVVAREVQRMVSLTGKTPEEVIKDISEGRILAENKTLQNIARSYYTSNTPAKSVIEQGITGRPVQKRTEAIDQLQPNLTDIREPDVSVQFSKELEAKRKEAGSMYEPSKSRPAGDELRMQLADALERIPSAGDEIKRALDIELKGSNLYEVAKRDDGSSYIFFNREPTQAEAEVVRSTISNVTDKAFKESSGTFGRGASGVESSLREVIDRVAPDVADARQAYAIAKGNEEAFKEGSKAFSGDTYESIDYIRNLDPEALRAYKAGVMSYLRNTATRGTSSSSLVNTIANEEGKVQMILRELLPESSVDDVMRSFDVAKGSQEAKNYVLGGSATQGTQEAKRGIGSGTEMADAGIRAMQGDPTGLYLVAKKLIAEQSNIPLNDKQMEEVAQYLVSTNPQFIARALQDDSLMAGLQQSIVKMGEYVSRGGRLVGAEQVGGAAGEMTAPMMIEVVKGLGAE